MSRRQGQCHHTPLRLQPKWRKREPFPSVLSSRHHIGRGSAHFITWHFQQLPLLFQRRWVCWPQRALNVGSGGAVLPPDRWQNCILLASVSVISSEYSASLSNLIAGHRLQIKAHLFLQGINHSGWHVQRFTRYITLMMIELFIFTGGSAGPAHLRR